jgi:hypothetical protein
MGTLAAGLSMPAIAPPLAISPEDLRTLGQWSRSGSIRAALAERAKILLLAAQGASNTEIARQVGCSRPTVILWRQRYTQHGLPALTTNPARAGLKRSAPTAAPRSWPPPCRHHLSTSGSHTGPPGC